MLIVAHVPLFEAFNCPMTRADVSVFELVIFETVARNHASAQVTAVTEDRIETCEARTLAAVSNLAQTRSL
jgi:hypothetical protein